MRSKKLHNRFEELTEAAAEYEAAATRKDGLAERCAL